MNVHYKYAIALYIAKDRRYNLCKLVTKLAQSREKFIPHLISLRDSIINGVKNTSEITHVSHGRLHRSHFSQSHIRSACL